jgi:hypothetical protein
VAQQHNLPPPQQQELEHQLLQQLLQRIRL